MTQSKHPHPQPHSQPHSAREHAHHAPPVKPKTGHAPQATGLPDQIYRLKPDYSARKLTKPVHFYWQAPGAKQVVIVGDFNDWNPQANPFKLMPDGTWRIELYLHHGHHQYYFLVDGKPMLDPRAQGVTRNAKGERVSLIPVS
jgi:hypothetical protein